MNKKPIAYNIKLIATILVIAGALFLSSKFNERRANSVKAVFSDKIAADFIVYFDDKIPTKTLKACLFDVSKDGEPFIAYKNSFISLTNTENGSPHVFIISGVDAIDDFAWMDDGSLLIISGTKLGALTEKGFVPFQELPAFGMKIEAASHKECYLYGGKSNNQKRNLYLYRKGGRLLHLLRAESPIDAVAGGGYITLVAIGSSICRLTPGEPLKLVYQAEDKIRSLVWGPGEAIFYSTANSVGFYRETEGGFPFLNAKDIQLQARGEDLYLFFPSQGVMRCSPAWQFIYMAKDLQSQLNRDR